MNKLTATLLCLAALLAAAALPAGASPAKGVKYVGKSSSGHKVTFKLVGKRATRFVTGVPTTCISIQGGGPPFVGAEPWQHSFRVNNRTQRWEAMVKPAFHYNEVTVKAEAKAKKLRNGTIRGRLRWQYSFLIPKFPIGTFSIYSCLAEARFKARPV